MRVAVAPLESVTVRITVFTPPSAKKWVKTQPIEAGSPQIPSPGKNPAGKSVGLPGIDM